MDRGKWRGYFLKKRLPSWPCPTCKQGTLKLDKDSLDCRETRESRRNRLGVNDPMEFERRFSCFAICSRESCGEVVIVAGIQGLEPSDYDGSLTEIYLPAYVSPPPPIIPIPKACPSPVRSELELSFGLFWYDPSAAATRIRIALEMLLTHLKIKRYEFQLKSNRKRRRTLSLHQRIELFSEKNPQIGGKLLAIKWIGNEGSHTGSLERNDLLDVYELLEYALRSLFTSTDRYLNKIAQEVNQRRGSRKRKKRT